VSSTNGSGSELLRVEGLEKYFPVTRGLVFQKEVGSVKAVDGVSFSLNAGETLGVVGESGCGKSTMARCIARLLEPTGGSITFEGRDITHLGRGEMRPVRRDMMMVFQDPYASLNPRKRVGSIVGEPLEVHGIGTDSERKRRVQELLEIVGLNPEHYNRFPHEFSGGQRQRIGIARALAINPKLIICDEPVSALDVSVQAQILNLLEDMKVRYGLTMIFIAHDLAVVKNVSDRVIVMYLGKICEVAGPDTLYRHPAHPYTWLLLESIPEPDPLRAVSDATLIGELPSPLDPPSGCRFRTRCPNAQERCTAEEPQIREVGPNHFVACHFPVLESPEVREP
jgi:peptide/nickel transport system ATP-binding protein